MKRGALLALIVLGSILPACVRKSSVPTPDEEDQKPAADVQFSQDAEEILKLDNTLLEDAVSFKSLSAAMTNKPPSARGIQINILVKEDWEKTVPLKLKSGDVRKLSDGAATADVVGLGGVSVSSVKPKSETRAMLKKILKDLGSATQAFDLITAEVNVQDGRELAEVLSNLNRTPGVLFSEPNAQIRAIAQPNDPRMGELWGLRAIKAPTVWQHRTGGNNITVAVIDTGVDLNHADLKENLWRNPGEIPRNNIDDDGNGFIDDVYGWNFVSDNNSPQDIHGHGTHCAGTIAAKGNNGIGVVGVNWDAQLMSIKVLDDFGIGSADTTYRGLLYALSHGARVLSNSWGTPGSSALFAKAISLAQEKDALVVAAAGNESSPQALYPAYLTTVYPNVLSVASSEQNSDISSFSNYGDGVDIAAPGGRILSTVPDNAYQIFSGTSMATPHVAGAAALLWNSFPNKSMEEIKAALLNGSDYIPKYEGKIAGARHLNLLGSVNRLLGTATPRPNSPPTLVEGLRFQYYQGKWNKLPDFGSVPVSRAGTSTKIALDVASRSNNFALVFEGVLKIEQPGEYIFYLRSNDGSQLFIDDKIIIRNNGIHSAREKKGKVELKKGLQKIRIEYFQATGGKTLMLEWKGPQFKRTNINTSQKLFHFM
ncbi:MAG: hypothetical protein RI932_395 [Pseudomonadota bacterium]|jgi:subtilisin family serine protease